MQCHHTTKGASSKKALPREEEYGGDIGYNGGDGPFHDYAPRELTFELTERQPQEAKPKLVKMFRVPLAFHARGSRVLLTSRRV